ncbi:hypothetical protein KP509_37G053500 [Ceratopteris richardii]|uniref:Ubiquitin-like domain-containing protein n=1 Tax=Ceratopteris richardii TaxID=49495 RepID=A0A8T2Q850_CERRI|nr:hypothetical protein KP509_37G053500 [Ceratopteris richardii]
MASGGGALDAKHATEASHSVVEIKIKTMDSQVYTCRVEKNVSVPDLKEQVALVTGVPSCSQRLICRGKVLKDDHALSAYEVEDGHTLHLVTRPPSAPASSVPVGADSEGQESHDFSSSFSRPGHIAHSVLVGTFNFPDRGSAVLPEINRIFSSVLSSLQIESFFPHLGADNGNTSEREQVGQIQRQRSADQSTVATHQNDNDSVDEHTGMHGDVSYVGVIPAVSHLRIVHQIAPSALTTMSQRLSHMEQILTAYEQAHVSSYSSNTAVLEATNPQASSSATESGELAAWSSIFRRIQALLGNQAASELLRLANQLETQQSIETILARGTILSTGMLLEQLGRLLLDLGSAALTHGREPPQVAQSINTQEPGGVLTRSSETSSHRAGHSMHYTENVNLGLPPSMVARNFLSQATQDGPSLTLNVESTSNSGINHSDQAFLQPPSSSNENMQESRSLDQHGIPNSDLPDFFQDSSSVDNTNGGRGIIYPLLARFRPLNPPIFPQQGGLSLDTSSCEEHASISEQHSHQMDFPTKAVQTAAENRRGESEGNDSACPAVRKQLMPTTSRQAQACSPQSQTDAGLDVMSTMKHDLGTTTTCSTHFRQDLERPLLHVLEAPTTISNEEQLASRYQALSNRGVLGKADAETSLQLKCSGPSCLGMDWSTCGSIDGACFSNVTNMKTVCVEDHVKKLDTSNGEVISEDFASDVTCSSTCKDFLSTLACRKVAESVREQPPNETTNIFSFESHELGLDCSGSSTQALPTSSNCFIPEDSNEKYLLDIGLHASGAPSGLRSLRDDHVGSDKICSFQDRHVGDDGKSLQQFFPSACMYNRRSASPALHASELENCEMKTLDNGKVKFQQSLSAVADENQEDSRKQRAMPSFEYLQAFKRQKTQ